MNRSRDRRAAVDLLVKLLRHQPEVPDVDRLCAAARTVSPSAVLDAAAYHAVSGHLWRALAPCADAPAELRSVLRERYDAAVRRHLQVMWELNRLAPILDSSDARWAVVKGPALVELVHRDAGVRSYADLDIIVEPRSFDRILSALDAAGHRPLDRNWTVIRRAMRGELHFVLPSGIPLDLHWHFVNMYRGGIRIDTSGVLRRATRERIGEVEAPVLDDTDTLIHLALHGTLSGGDRLLWIADVAAAVRILEPDWTHLVDRARAWHVAAPVGYMLRRARAVLDAPVPDGVPERLLGRYYHVASAAVDRVSPWQSANGRLTAASLLLTRSMGLGPGGAMAWLVSRTVRHFDPREPERSSNFTPSGTPADFDAFVRAVVGWRPRER